MGFTRLAAQRAISINGYQEAPLEDFKFKDIDIEAKSAGSIQNAKDQYRSLKAACSRARLGRLLLFRAAHVSKRSLGLVGAP